MKNEAAAKVDAMIKKIFPAGRFLGDAKISEGLKKDMVTTLFAIAKGRSTCSAEAGHLPVCRLGSNASRQLICSPTNVLM